MAKHLLYIFSIAFLIIAGCKGSTKQDTSIKNNLQVIRERGKLIALTDYNSTSYFIYRGTPMGYHYELLQNLANYLEVELEIKVTNNLDEAFRQIKNQECDILAISLSVTTSRKEQIAFTQPIGETRQVLVQRKPMQWENLSPNQINDILIRNPLELGNKTVHVLSNSSFEQRLHNLQEEIGENINIKKVENYDMEQLITLVAQGEIDYTIADEDIARINQTYHPEIDIETTISFPQKQAWAVNLNNASLLEATNNWLSGFRTSALFSVIYNKYFRDKKATQRFQSPYQSVKGGKISNFDELIKKYAKNINWDWRLLASMIYQESRFDPDVISWAGAYGIMQLMPATAQRFGTWKGAPVKTNIMAGTKFIAWLDEYFEEITPYQERIKFIMASYNAGFGHVQDARRLAEAHGKNPDIWEENVDYYLKNKSNPAFYNHPVVKYGYCRGEEPYSYVSDILSRYEIYKKLIPQ